MRSFSLRSTAGSSSQVGGTNWEMTENKQNRACLESWELLPYYAHMFVVTMRTPGLLAACYCDMSDAVHLTRPTRVLVHRTRKAQARSSRSVRASTWSVKKPACLLVGLMTHFFFVFHVHSAIHHRYDTVELMCVVPYGSTTNHETAKRETKRGTRQWRVGGGYWGY